MRGYITERHFSRAERVFPGIRRFYRCLAHKPATFLELVWEYEHGSVPRRDEPSHGDRRARRPPR